MRQRPRRLRGNQGLRRLVQETELMPRMLIQPLFVVDGIDGPRPIDSMPGQFHQSMESLLISCAAAADLGLGGVILFGIPASKDATGSQSWASNGIIQRACQRIKAEFGSRLLVIADLCLCEYTDHGHCGLVNDGRIDNDQTLEIYGRIAASQAAAGADVVAPSGMMDGQVGAIRDALDQEHFSQTPIMAYAAKYASAFYGPFREAAASTPRSGDRRSHQMDPANAREALREIRLDEAQGADMVMVKPALAYLDVLARARAVTDLPLGAYNVSAEYSMVKAAAQLGWVDERAIILELLTGIRRAGADFILTYHALEVGQWLGHG